MISSSALSAPADFRASRIAIRSVGVAPSPQPAGGAAKTKEAVAPNLLSGGLAGAYVSFAAVLSITVASALGDVSPGVSKLVFGGLFLPSSLQCTGICILLGLLQRFESGIFLLDG
mgnify:CR=1 FL=1